MAELTRKELLAVIEELKSERDAAIEERNRALDEAAAWEKKVDLWIEEGEFLAEFTGSRSVLFKLGCWWADRPWRNRP